MIGFATLYRALADPRRNAIGASIPQPVADLLELWVVGEYLGLNDVNQQAAGGAGRTVLTKAQFDARAREDIRRRVAAHRAAAMAQSAAAQVP